MKLAASSTTRRGASMSPWTLQPARNSQRSAAVMLPSTVPSTMTDLVLISPLIRAFLPMVSRPVASILPSTSQSTSSSFENFTLPLMETPLDKVPAVRAVSGAPFPAAGFGAAGGVVGSVAAIGMAGSTFRLLENICMILDSFDWRIRKHHQRQALSGQPFVCVLTESANELGFSSANGKEVEDGAAQTEGGGAEEVRGGADFT